MTEFNPDYPKTVDDALDMLQTMHDADNTDNDFCYGYRMGLRLGISLLTSVKRNGIKNE